MKTRSRYLSEMITPLCVHLLTVVPITWMIIECFLETSMVT